MPVTYSPTAHTAPETAQISGTPIYGPAPGEVYATLSDPHAPAYVWLPTNVTPDGYPAGLAAFPTGTGTVT